LVENVRRILQQDEGQTLVEYALIIAAVSLTLVVALTGISDALARAFNSIASALNGIVS
jgi:pilus assembly protein Flp/PilA